MLILLPPSETKRSPRSGRPLDLASLSFPGLTAVREQVIDALVGLAQRDPATAREVLGVSVRQQDEVSRDAALWDAPTAPAARIYTGVLFDALDVTTLPAAARRRARSSLVMASALFGAVRIGDRIPAYRLSAGARLPGLRPVDRMWGDALATALPATVGAGLLVDLRSTAYLAMWRPTGPLAARTATVRVLHERPDGSRGVVSHFNKATKGRLTRAVLTTPGTPRNVDELVDLLRSCGYHVEPGEALTGRPRRLDVVVSDL